MKTVGILKHNMKWSTKCVADFVTLPCEVRISKQSSSKPTDGFGKHLIPVFISKLCFRTPNAPSPSYLFNAFIQGQNQSKNKHLQSIAGNRES